MPTKGKTHAKGKARPANEKPLAKDKGEASIKEHAPAPLDAEGREICFLFLKYGKCRYGKKCKKSHNSPDPSTYAFVAVWPVAYNLWMSLTLSIE